MSILAIVCIEVVHGVGNTLNSAILDYVYFYTDTGRYMIVCVIQHILHAGKVYSTTYILCLYLGLEYGLLKDKRNYKSF